MTPLYIIIAATIIIIYTATKLANKSHDRQETTPADRGGIPDTTPILTKPKRRLRSPA